MFVTRQGNPVTRAEYDDLLKRIQALEENYGRRETKVDSGKRD